MICDPSLILFVLPPKLFIQIREGMTVLSCPTNCNKDDRSFSIWVFSTLGRARILDEKHLDAVTGLSGSGPAFAWLVI